MSDEPGLKILASRQQLPHITRRAFVAGFTVTAAAGGTVILSACGNSGSEGASSGSPSPSAASSGPIEGQLNMYNWADYDAPSLYKKFEQEVGPTIKVSVFDSNEQAIAKLNAAEGTSGYDVMCPTGVFIPLMVQQELLEPLDHSRIPNFDNLLPEVLDQSWDPGNKYSVPKDWGTSGYMYDKRVVTREMKTWADFVTAMQNEAKNNTAVAATPMNLCSLYFWSQDPPLDWTTTDKSVWDNGAKPYILQEVAPYVKNYDPYPAITMTQGKYALAMMANGDARAALTRGTNAENYEWVFPGPTSEIWTDTWTIIANAPNPNAAYAWINFILDPVNSYTDLQYHGYNTGVKGMEEKAKADNIPYPEIVFYTPEQVATMVPGAVNEATEWATEIAQEAKVVSAS